MPMELPKPVSFLRSIWEGIKGYFKGGFAGMAIGALLVGGIAAAIAVVAPEGSMEIIKGAFPSLSGAVSSIAGTAGSVSHLGAAGAAALVGGAWGGGVFGSIGSLAGIFTGVAKSREAGQLTSGQFANAMTMSQQHGQMVGAQQTTQQFMGRQQQEDENRWRKYAEERAQAAPQHGKPH